MGWDKPELWLLGGLAFLLISAGIEDARRREIANWKNAAIALLAPLWWWANGVALWPDTALLFGVALGVFALFAATFYAGWMGGGDVKMIGALALWMPLGLLMQFLVVMSLVGGALTLAMLIEQRLSRRRTIEVPYGIAIAVAALLSFGKLNLNQFL